MRKLITLLLMGFAGVSLLGQTSEIGKVIEYQLPAEDRGTGTFYLGRFSIGTFEISANVEGIHANNKGWKIIVGTDYNGGSRKFKIIYNNIQGEFIYQKYNVGQFDLWWDAKHPQSGGNWTPHIKVEFQYGACNYNNAEAEPERTNAIVLNNYKDNVEARTAIIEIPNAITDWNRIWQCGFFDSSSETNAPEKGTWFWGLNMGHRSNHSDYRYGGQILIRNSSTLPTMYFRSRNNEGEGHWAKVLHNFGDQNINGNLTVNGKINSEEIKVEDIAATNMNLSGDIAANNITLKANGNTADFVFEPEYNLRDLCEVESYIKANKCLPDIPNAAQMEEQGVNLAEMNKLLLQKVEELTLHTIAQEKKLNVKDKEVEELMVAQQKMEEARKREQGEREKLEERLATIETLLMVTTPNP